MAAPGYYAVLAQQRPLDFADHFSRAYLQGQAQRAARERDEQMIAGQRDYERERMSLIPEAERAYAQRGDAQMLREIAPEHLAKLEQAQANKARFEEAQQAQMQAAQQRQRVAELRRAAAGGDADAVNELAATAPDDPFLHRFDRLQTASAEAQRQGYSTALREASNAYGLTPEQGLSDPRVQRLMQKRAAPSAASQGQSQGTQTQEPKLRQLAPSSVEGLADAETAVGNVDSLLQSFVATVPNDGTVSRIGARASGYVPNTDVARYQNDANVTAQIIGTFLEGGKLAEADLPRYKNMLPQPGDSIKTAQAKANTIRRLVRERASGRVKTLQAAGYAVPGQTQQTSLPQGPDGDIDLNGAAELTDEELEREIAAAGGVL